MSSGKKVSFSNILETYEDSLLPLSPQTSMVLRSHCKNENCLNDNSASSKKNFKVSRHHHHHHPSVENQSTAKFQSILNSSLSKTTQFSVYETVSMKESENISSQVESSPLRISLQTRNTTSDLKNAKNQFNLSAGERNFNVDHVSNNKKLIVKVNKLNDSFLSKSMVHDYTKHINDIDFEDQPKTDYTYSRSRSYNSRETPSRDNSSPNMSRTRLRTSGAGDYSSDEEMSFLLHGNLKATSTQEIYNRNDFPTSTPIFINNSWENHTTSHNHGVHSIQNIQNGIFYKIFSFIVYTCFFGLLNRIFNIWCALWKGIYTVICQILILDTWLLSRLRKRKYLLLLPLLALLLFWLLGGSENTSVIRSVPSSIVTSASSYLSFLSSDWSSFKGFWSFGATRVQSKPTEELLYRTGEQSEAKFDIEQIKSLLKTMVYQESKSREEQVQKILLDLKENVAFTNNQDMKFDNFVSQFKILSEELVTVKAAMGKIQEQTNEDKPTEIHFEFLKTKLTNIEEELKTLQVEIETQKSCCKNQTFFIKEADKHCVKLMFDMFNIPPGKGSDRFSQFQAAIRTLFENQDDLKSRLEQIDNLHLSETSFKMSQIAREEVNNLRKEIKYNESKKSTTKVGIIASSASDNRTGTCASQDEVQKIVKNALFVYDADKTGQVDYALESSGGSVISTRCAETYPTGTGQYRLFGVPIWSTSNSPRIAIQPEVHPGQCWAFKGTHGYLVVQLASTIRPTAFTVEHIHKSLSPTGNIDSAPKDFSVFGLKREDDFDGKLLGHYQFEDNNESLQYFIVQDPDPGEFGIIELRINSNHGNTDYTCLYRFRVHGTRV